LARSGYYAWKQRPLSARRRRDQHLTAQIHTVFQSSRQTYGSPRVHAALQAQGVACARKRVARLMRAAALVGRRRRRRVRTTDSRHAAPVAPNALAQAFTTDAPNRVWATDITYLPTRDG
jgi:transposase InsO family protein